MSSGWITEPGWCLSWLEGTSIIIEACHVCEQNQAPALANFSEDRWKCPICGAIHPAYVLNQEEQV